MTEANQNLIIRNSAGYVSEIKSGMHILFTDEPDNQRGEDTRSEPYEVLISAKMQIRNNTDLIW